MKSLLTILLVTITFLLSFAGCNFTAKVKDISDITYFNFSYTVSNMANGNVSYTLQLKDGIYTATIKENGIPEEEATIITVDESFTEELVHFLNENKVTKWNGFDKSDKNVMDGNSFHLNITMSEETFIDAYGYMKWPKNYSVVKEGVQNLFTELTKE